MRRLIVFLRSTKSLCSPVILSTGTMDGEIGCQKYLLIETEKKNACDEG